MLTPLALVLIVIDVMDLVFAVDSIPAVFAITRDPFIVYTSNIFAILGLRAMYFLLARVIDKFHLLKIGLAIVLLFVGVKMVIAEWVKIPIGISLAFIGGVLTVSVIASIMWPKQVESAALEDSDDESSGSTDHRAAGSR
jgi:tellurite resistance protein TerC